MGRIIRTGKVLGHQWDLLENLGRGGMAVVFRAFSEILRRGCAVKVQVVDPNADNPDELRKRFERECCVLAQLSHPHLVKAFNFYPATPGQPIFFTMEHIEGESLKELTDLPLPGEERQQGGGPLSEERALRIMLQICEAIMALHEAGVYHRDLKPGNIMVSQRDGRDHATLIDLGICKCTAVWYAGLEQRTPVEQRFETDPGRELGTPGFMGAGEHADLASRDVFGLCATLVKIVLGRTPYRPEPKPGEVLEWRPADDERISASLKSVLERGLRADPLARYTSVARLHEELGYVLQEIADEHIDAASVLEPVHATELEPVPPTVDDARREEVHTGNEIDEAKAAPLAAIAETDEAAKPRQFVRRIVGALACVGISIGIGWYFVGRTPRTSIADAADHAAAGTVAERATADAHGEATLDRDGDHAQAMPAGITPKEHDVRPPGLRRPVAEPTTPSRRHALTKASFRRVLETKRSVLDKCSQLLEVGAVVDAIVRISATGEVARVRLSPTASSFLVESCVRDAVGDLRFPATATASTHRVRLRQPPQK